MGKTLVSEMDIKSFKKFLNAQPKLYHFLLKKLSQDLIELQGSLKDTAYKPAKVKIANTLLKSISFKSKDTNSPTIHGLKELK